MEDQDTMVSDEAYDAADHEMGPQFYSAGIYLKRLAYGGPEEGGWWFDTGEPSEETEHAVLTRIFPTSGEAIRYATSTLAPVCEEDNKGRPSYSSVISYGVYEWRVARGYPVAFPDKRPHYE